MATDAIDLNAARDARLELAGVDRRRNRSDERTAAIASISRDFAFDNDVLPVVYRDGCLIIGIADEEDSKKVEAVRLHSRVAQVRATRVDIGAIRKTLPKIYPSPGTQDDSQIGQLFEQVMKAAVLAHATDVHIEPLGPGGGRARFRVDSVMREYRELDEETLKRLVSYIKVRCEMDSSETQVPLDGQCKVELDGRTINVRASAITSVHGQNVAMRLLGQLELVRSLSHSGLRPEIIAKITAGALRPNAFMVVCGPTGSGKTTLLYGIMLGIDFSRWNAYSVEDPVEMVIPGVEQVQVNEKAGKTFAVEMRGFMRQNPDLILLGETRDQETAVQCLTGGTSGMRLLTTMHARSACSIPDRLQEFGGSRARIAGALTMGVAQRLVSRLCRCKKKTDLSKSALDLAEKAKMPLVLENVAAAVGCSECQFTGYTGQFGIIEILDIVHEVADVIRSDVSRPIDIARAGARFGYEPMMIDGLRRVLAGETSEAELTRVLAYEDLLL